MMENRSFDHFLGWLPGADGRHDLVFLATDGKFYPNYPLAPDFQGCGYSDPDHSWEGLLVQHNFGKMDGFLQRPTAPAGNPGVTLAKANTFPIGYYTNLHPDGTPQGGARPAGDRRAWPRTTRCSTITSARSRARRSRTGSTSTRRGPTGTTTAATSRKLPTIWDQLSPIPNTQGIPTGGYFFRDLPFLALWGPKYLPFWHPFDAGDNDAVGIPVQAKSFLDTVAAGNCRTSASSTRPSTPRATAPRPTITRWPTSALGRAVHRRRVPRPGNAGLPGQHRLHRHLR